MAASTPAVPTKTVGLPSRVLQPLVISAPFGNYIQPRGATPTLGTFTAAARPGRLTQVIRTVRWSPSLGAWVNKIGLRNPGIDWLSARVSSGRTDVSGKIVSIHGFTPEDWSTLLIKTVSLDPLAVELNMSCPNVGCIDEPDWLFARAAAMHPMIAVKLPPVNYRGLFTRALDAGVRLFHCCNTLPVPRGGVSGKPLKPVALQCVRDVLELGAARNVSNIRIIGGGGITSPADIDDYAAAGASHVAVATKCFNPMLLFTDRPLRPLIERAAALLGNGAPVPVRGVPPAPGVPAVR